MPHLPETPNLLRDLGHRVTPQRLMILDILQHEPGHLTAEEVFVRVQARFPYTDISTVYRTLKLLTELGLVRRVGLGQSTDSYEWIDRPHHHLVCQGCGTVEDIGDELLSQVRELVERQHRFQIAKAYLEVFGTCPRCQAVAPADPVSSSREERRAWTRP